jgi:hypothetical protein
MWFMSKEGIKLSNIHHQKCAVCGEKAPVCSTAFIAVRSFNSGKETAQVYVHE